MIQFYQLTLEDAIADYRIGQSSAVLLLKNYIRISFAPEWRIVLNPKKVCLKLGISKSTFYRALNKLKEAGWAALGKTETQTEIPIYLTSEAPNPKAATNSPSHKTNSPRVATNSPRVATNSPSPENRSAHQAPTDSHFPDSPDLSSDLSSNSSHSFSKEGEPEKKEKEKKKKENTNTGINQATSNRKESQNDNSSLVNNLNPVEDKSSAAAHNSQVILPKSDVANKSETALDVNRPSPQTQKEKQFNWVPAGPWCDENKKLNPQFVEWLARDWQKAYGGDLHRKKADVLRHFVKNPANIAISWQQYQSEYLHRYQNASVRMQHGLEIHIHWLWHERSPLLSTQDRATIR